MGTIRQRAIAGTKGRHMHAATLQRKGDCEERAKPYRAPTDIRMDRLSTLLAGTERFPTKKQMDFLGQPTEVKDDTTVYYSGDASLLKRPCVAIVGTRQVSDLGRQRTIRLARGLVDAGITVVSGLAYGVDATAHRTAIDRGGKTIAVIGTPLNKASPSENANMQEEIYRDHLLISQFAMGEKTSRASFPQRNKLMATLSDATVVMEASDTSGTLHQAAECTKLGRWLFIARSVVEDKNLTWPAKFLKYETCLPLDDVKQIVDRVTSTPRAS